ncbi:unnamed protein product, partial [Ceratitis capitata]
MSFIQHPPASFQTRITYSFIQSSPLPVRMSCNATFLLDAYEGIVFDTKTPAAEVNTAMAYRRTVIRLLIKSLSIILVALLVHQSSTKKWTQLRCWNRIDRRNNQGRLRG